MRKEGQTKFIPNLPGYLVIAGIILSWSGYVVVALNTAPSNYDYYAAPGSKPFVFYILHGAGILSLFTAGILSMFRGEFSRSPQWTRLAFWVMLASCITWALVTYHVKDYLSMKAFGSTGPFVWMSCVLIFAGMDRTVWKLLEPLIRYIAYATSILLLISIKTNYHYVAERWLSAPVQYMVLLMWFGGWTLFTSWNCTGAKRYVRWFPYIVFTLAALITQTRSWCLMSILSLIAYIHIDRVANDKRAINVIGLIVKLGFIVSTILLIIFCFQDFFNGVFDRLSNRALEDSRTGQYVEFFSQVSPADLLFGGGPNATYSFGTSEEFSEYQYFDNSYLWMAFIGGLPLLVSYFIVTILPGIKLFFRGVAGNDAAAAILILLWGLACTGLSTYSNPSLTPYSYLICLLSGRCLGAWAEYREASRANWALGPTRKVTAANENTMRDSLNMLFRHKGKILGIFLTVVLFVTVWIFTGTPLYLARATLLIKPVIEDTPRPGKEGGNGSNSNLILSQEELINTAIQVLTGRELAEKVIGTLTLSNMYPELIGKISKDRSPMVTAVGIFERNLKIAPVQKSNVITLTFHHRDPKLAAGALNLLVDCFKEQHLALHSNPQSSFIATQLTTSENKLKESENSLQKFKQDNKVYSLEEQRNLLLKQRIELDTSYKVAQNNIAELDNKISEIHAQLSRIFMSNSTFTPTERDRILTDALNKRLDLQLKEQETRRKYADDNPLVDAVKKEVELVTKYLDEQEKSISANVKTGNPVYQAMETDMYRAQGELHSQIAKVESLKRQLKQLDVQIAQLDLSDTRIRNMKNDVAIKEKTYKTYADRKEEASIREALSRLKLSSISIIQPAGIPSQPLDSNNMLKLMGGVFFGMWLGFSCAYMLDKMDQTFSDPENVEKYLGVPVLLTIPHKEAKN